MRKKSIALRRDGIAGRRQIKARDKVDGIGIISGGQTSLPENVLASAAKVRFSRFAVRFPTGMPYKNFERGDPG